MKTVISALTEVAEPLRGEYIEKDGKFHLKVEGDYAPLIESNNKLTEFRDNNRTLNTKVTELEGNLKKFEGIDPVEHTKLKAKITELEKGGIKGKDDIAVLIQTAVQEAVGPLQKTIKDREESEKAAQVALARKSLEADLRDAGGKVGIDERAMRDYVNRGLDVWKLVDGVAQPRNKSDTPIFSKEKPAEVISMTEWAEGLRVDAPHLFTPSRGGGAGGNGSGGGGGGTIVKKSISSDPLEFGKNLEGIAKGEVTIQQ